MHESVKDKVIKKDDSSLRVKANMEPSKKKPSKKAKKK